MASITSELLFKGKHFDRYRDEAWHHAPPDKRVRHGFDSQYSSSTLIHTGPPPPPQPPPPTTPTPVINPLSSYFIKDLFGQSVERNVSEQNNRRSDFIRWNVVSDKDTQRGFRMFDGIMMSVKDVSSEELFLERIKLVYSAYDTYVAGQINKSPLDIAKALIRAVTACLTSYFSTQSMLRTNRPFIAKVLHLDCPDMFCTHSEFLQAFLFTNASAEDEAVIALAENVYSENNFNVCEDFSGRRSSSSEANNNESVNRRPEDELFDLAMRIAERNVVGGSHSSFTMKNMASASKYATLTDDLPFTQNEVPGNSSEKTTAMLIVVTDFESLQNYIAYALYLTPMKLSRRYNVNFDCFKRPSSGPSYECCSARESKNRRKKDGAKAAIRAVIEQKRRDKIDNMGERSAACEAVLHKHASRTIERNNDVLCHVLLMLFDKCLSCLIDRGFENLNTRRGYAVNSAKEIGTATIYTGIIDTVGEVSTSLERHKLDSMATISSKHDQHSPRFTLPPNTITFEVTPPREWRSSRETTVEENDEDRGNPRGE